jgi:hypothetical protein
VLCCGYTLEVRCDIGSPVAVHPQGIYRNLFVVGYFTKGEGNSNLLVGVGLTIVKPDIHLLNAVVEYAFTLNLCSLVPYCSIVAIG